MKRETEEEVSDGGSSKLSNEEEWVEGGRRGYKRGKVQESISEELLVKVSKGSGIGSSKELRG